MKMRLLLFGSAALLVAGCESTPQNPYTSSEEFMFTYDMVPQPLPGIAPDELEKLYPGDLPGYSDSSAQMNSDHVIH